MKRRYIAAGWGHQYALVEAAAGRMEWREGSDALQVLCYHDTVPAFVESDIARLYGALYSSIPLLRVYGTLKEAASTFVLHRNGQLDAILLFRIESDSTAAVLNEGMTLAAPQLRAFARYIFARYPSVSVIRFPNLDWQGDCRIGYPSQHYRISENIALPLPATPEAYHAQLGKNTRRNLKRYGDRLVRDYPDYQWQVGEGSEFAEEDLRAIIELNVVRMASKNKTSAYDAAETARLVRLTRECGLVGVARIGGRVAAGTLAFRTGEHVALSVLSHDPRYNDYSLGLLCAYEIICESIRRQAREFQFLWGRYDYKFILLARERPLQRLVIYRSWVQAVLHGDIFLRAAGESARRWVAGRLHQLGRQQNFTGRLCVHLLDGARRLRSRLPPP